MRAIGGLWRWRHNPLRRTTDLAEAWVALAALLVMLLAAPVVGALVDAVAQDALQRTVRDQRLSRHQVPATVVRELGGSMLGSEPESVPGRDGRTRVVADWTAPDGTPHHGTVLAGLTSAHRGDRFLLWTDTRGRPVGRPLDSATATTHAVVAGCGAALLTAGVVEAFRRLAVRQMVRRRYARWDQAWNRAGPDRGRTGAGS
ncbi:hypothetical protein ACF09K_12920 [Streptomyces sp. NPDC014882]|uniref:Rv1733c family protein n=1 Tax=Streptomyces sp. NPDC014882 TaxID=3364927 RepID=UPI0036F7E34D